MWKQIKYIVRRGQVQTIDITVLVARALRHTRDQMMREALNPQDYEMIRQTHNQDINANEHINVEDDITYL